MHLNQTVAVVVPAFKEELQITGVIQTMPDYVDLIVVVDDASPAPDRTCEIVENLAGGDSRIVLVARPENGGVGAAIEDGYREAVRRDADVIGVMAGDGQMDPNELIRLVAPVAEGRCDYAKGNRYNLQSNWSEIPRVRKIGSIILSFMTRIATGYWSIGDSQNGYAVSSRPLTEQFLRRGIYPRYGVPNDLLLTAAINSAVVMDVPMDPVYGVGEESKLRPRKVAMPIALLLLKGFWIRMWYRHTVLETTPVPIAYVSGLASLSIGFFWSVLLVFRTVGTSVTTVEVTAASLLFIGGAIILLLALVLDVLLSSPLAVRGSFEGQR
tara:strand:+ start:3325 stop:4302 length:978 start_codon:yes stop_codon:yes gene_type:complete